MDRRCTVRIKNLRFYNSAGICNSPAEQDSIFTENREKPRKTWDSDLSASLFCDKLS